VQLTESHVQFKIPPTSLTPRCTSNPVWFYCCYRRTVMRGSLSHYLETKIWWRILREILYRKTLTCIG